MKEKYIRGKRRVFAILYFLESILRGNWLSAKRELEIIKGHAKPYKIVFAESAKDSFKELGFSEGEIREMEEK